jgi:hypothetical protein
MHRDEEVWRQIEVSRKQRTNPLATSPFLTALLSWKYDILYILKSVLHWLIGQAVTPIVISYFGTPSYSFELQYSRIIIYALCIIILALFVTVLVYYRPRQIQPATWGHIRTLADLIDDWALDKTGRFWWGDKGLYSNGIRHAGTRPSQKDLGGIRESALYQ